MFEPVDMTEEIAARSLEQGQTDRSKASSKAGLVDQDEAAGRRAMTSLRSVTTPTAPPCGRGRPVARFGSELTDQSRQVADYTGLAA
jgi:hypothetical protein